MYIPVNTSNIIFYIMLILNLFDVKLCVCVCVCVCACPLVTRLASKWTYSKTVAGIITLITQFFNSIIYNNYTRLRVTVTCSNVGIGCALWSLNVTMIL